MTLKKGRFRSCPGVAICVRADDDEEKREKSRKMAAEVLKDLSGPEPQVAACSGTGGLRTEAAGCEKA